MFNKILIVCVGNICRSPTAECLFSSRLTNRNYTIASAGIHALAGKAMDPTAHKVLVEHGYTHEQHVARQLNTGILHNADIILAMEKAHIGSILALSPGLRGKVFLLGKWQQEREIPDPYKQPQSMYDHAYTLIDEAVNAWIKRLD